MTGASNAAVPADKAGGHCTGESVGGDSRTRLPGSWGVYASTWLVRCAQVPPPSPDVTLRTSHVGHLPGIGCELAWLTARAAVAAARRR